MYILAYHCNPYEPWILDRKKSKASIDVTIEEFDTFEEAKKRVDDLLEVEKDFTYRIFPPGKVCEEVDHDFIIRSTGVMNFDYKSIKFEDAWINGERFLTREAALARIAEVGSRLTKRVVERHFVDGKWIEGE